MIPYSRPRAFKANHLLSVSTAGNDRLLFTENKEDDYDAIIEPPSLCGKEITNGMGCSLLQQRARKKGRRHTL